MTKYILSSIFIFFSVSTAFSQTVEEIVDLHINAIGGYENLAKVQTVKIDAVSSVGGYDIPVTIYLKKPNNLLLEINVQGMTMKQAYDGTSAWTINPFQGNSDPEVLKGPTAKALIRLSDLDGPIVNFKDKGYTAELIGKEKIENVETYNIKLTDKDGDYINYFIDTENFMLIKQSSVIKDGEKSITSTSSFTNYKPVEGVVVAYNILSTSSDNPMGPQKINISAYTPNIEIDNSIFVMPTK
ncbi:MAG TPA: hypothetical protein PLG90_02500 [Ignavibacteria bacterium]|nr:hypothetical protein [Ignavibacteria bacterium]